MSRSLFTRTQPPSGDVVVLVHGLAAHRIVLKPLEKHLNRCGFATVNWGYPSVWGGINGHASRLLSLLAELERKPDVEHIRLVTHSMGGIVARRVLAKSRLEKIRSLVMLGPPNRGSRVAAVLARGLGWFCRPLSELSDAENSFVNMLAVPDGIEVGIIAALFDRVVSVESTHVPGERDHCVVPRGHTSMLFSSDVAECVAAFLRQGHFGQNSMDGAAGESDARDISPSTHQTHRCKFGAIWGLVKKNELPRPEVIETVD